jgi:hypothetical protein
MVYTHSTNIYGLVKLFLLKFSVGLIVLEVSVGGNPTGGVVQRTCCALSYA